MFAEKEIVIRRAMELLGADYEEISERLLDLHMDGKAKIEKSQNPEEEDSRVYLRAYYYAETHLAKWLAERLVNSQEPDGLENMVRETEAELSIELSESQREAVILAVRSGVSVITGGPGTGKTTIISVLVRVIKKLGLRVKLAAPTGRAARRMQEVTGVPAQTIHRMLEAGKAEESGRNNFGKDEDNPVETDVLIVDESSMVDLLLCYYLVRATKPTIQMVFVGDQDQLPSIGAGSVLADMINCGVIPVVKLAQVFRQAEASTIITNAHRINRGLMPVYDGDRKDFFLVKRQNHDILVQEVLSLVGRLAGFLDCDALWEIQVLTPMRKGPVGSARLNTLLQAKLNPANRHKREKYRGDMVFREGDKVVQTKNNYETGVYNGDMGRILRIDDGGVFVGFEDGREVGFNQDELDDLELAYALTVHKAQGSEFPGVIIPVHMSAPGLLNRNLLYTAVTRAKRVCVMVGEERAVRAMVNNARQKTRNSGLAGRLADYCGQGE